MEVIIAPPASDSGSPITRYSIAATPAVGASVGVGGTLGQPVPGTNRVGGVGGEGGEVCRWQTAAGQLAVAKLGV